MLWVTYVQLPYLCLTLYLQKHPDNRHAIVYELTSPNRTPQHLSHVKYSLRLCSFIGDLYQACLLSRLDTIGCVRILLFNMAMVEHLTGIENILKRAGPKLWKESMYASPSLGATSFASANSCNSPSELCWSILDWEVREFENQIRSARGRVQDNQFLLRDNEHNKIEGGVRRKVDGLIRYAWECCRFLREGYAGDGRYVAVGGWQPSISVDWRHSNFC
ncbi:hypothetical protein CPB83DRAFT_865374 [Crepidotus variabilis]|uniref:Uncharacterized protein n=1 Tax=Crepidotus variabilis TaxID=179855 RepID=A0A9P6E337_9AGAR|nr:hypothetical protein CPB83DRAFT_865374 [Crepidotus variabilis]